MYSHKIITAAFIASALLLSACGGSSTANTIEEENRERNEGRDEARDDADESRNDAENDRDEARDDADEDRTDNSTTNFVSIASVAWDASLSTMIDSRRAPLNDIAVGATNTVVNETIECSSNGNIDVELKRAGFDLDEISTGDFDNVAYNDCAFSAFSSINGSHKVTYNSSFTLSDSDDVLPEYAIEEGDEANLDIEFSDYSFETDDVTVEINGLINESIINGSEDTIDISSDNLTINTSVGDIEVNAQYSELKQSQRRNLSSSTYAFSQDFTTALDWTIDSENSSLAVSFETTQDFSGMFNRSFDEIEYSAPSSGEAIITSDQGNIKIAVESESIVQISFDSDKDGNYEIVENIDSEDFFGDEPTFLSVN